MPISRILILVLNLLLMVMIYVYAATLTNSQSAAFWLSLFHIGTNLTATLFCLLIYVIQELSGDNGKFTLSLIVTFFLSTLLLGLLSFPAYWILVAITSSPDDTLSLLGAALYQS